MLNEQEPWACVAYDFTLNRMKPDSELVSIIEFNYILFRYLRDPQRQQNSILIQDTGLEVAQDPELFFSCMKLGQIIVFQEFLYMWKMLSELFRKNFRRYGLLFLDFFL